MIYPDMSLLALGELYGDRNRDNEARPVVGEITEADASLLAALIGVGALLIIVGVWWLTTGV